MKFNITELYDKVVVMIDNKRRLSREQGTKGTIVFSLENLEDITDFGREAIVVALKEIEHHGQYKFSNHEEITLKGVKSFRVNYEVL